LRHHQFLTNDRNILSSLSILVFFLAHNAEAKASHTSEELEDEAIQEWKGGGAQYGSQIITQSPRSENNAAPQMANIGKVKFQPPNVPVIFVLG
jgi:hypothetical protein